MQAPEQDLARRVPVWDAMQMLFMDIDAEDWLLSIADTCVKSGYTLEEIEAILFNEVLPACSANLLAVPGGEWRGFESAQLQAMVLEKHRFGKRKPFLHRRYAADWWQQLAPLITEKLLQES